ncbi:MAG: hypothetical protein WC872_03695 [Candidatus Absconditabacterales bacterium]
MKNFLRTTLFWLIIFVLFGFYLKSFNPNLGGQVASRINNGAQIDSLSGQIEDPTLSGINNIQTTLINMQTKLDEISTKIGNPVVSEIKANPILEKPVLEKTSSGDIK